MEFEVVVNDRRIGEGYKTFKEMGEALLQEMNRFMAQCLKTPAENRPQVFPPFHIGWVRYKIGSRYYIVVSGNVTHFCLRNNLFERVGSIKLAHEPTEEQVRNFFLEYGDLMRRAHPRLWEEKEKFLEHIQ
jgi:hypothetical protein